MPRKNFENIGALQRFEYLPGEIEQVDGESDTCTVFVGGEDYADVPIFYHCNPDSEERENGAIRGAAGGFAPGDDVVVLRERKSDGDEPLKLFVIGHVGEARRCRSVIIVSSPSGDEAFAWDPIDNELAVAKDTLANVLGQLGPDPVQAIPAGMYESRSEYPHGEVTGSGQSYSTITLSEGQSDYIGVIYPHKNASVIGPHWLCYQPLAFGEDGNPEEDEDYNYNRGKWSPGDYVHVRTYAGSSIVTIVEVSVEDEEGATFNEDHIWVPDANFAINQDWFFRVYTPPHGDNYRAVWIEGTGHSGTQDYGPALDYQYFLREGSGFPIAPGDVSDTGNAWRLHYAGLGYECERGNYIEHDGQIIAPYLHYLEYRASSDVVPLKELYTSLTGVSPEDGLELQRHIHLYYIPIFGWDYYSYVIHNNMGHLDQSLFSVEKIFDSWINCEISGTETELSVNGGLYTTAGKAEKGDIQVVYDAYNITINGEYQSGLHLYAKVPAAVAMTPLELRTLELTNEERVNDGADPLPFNMALQRAAKRHLDDMLEHWEEYLYYFENIPGSTHTGTDGTEVWNRCGIEGYVNHWKMYIAGHIPHATENNALVIPPENWEGDITTEIAAYFVLGWMESEEGHRENLLDPAQDDIGIACGVAPDGNYVAVQVFGQLTGRPAGYFSLTEDAAYMGEENVGGWLKGFIDDNFTWAGAGDESRIPKIYLT